MVNSTQIDLHPASSIQPPLRSAMDESCSSTIASRAGHTLDCHVVVSEHRASIVHRMCSSFSTIRPCSPHCAPPFWYRYRTPSQPCTSEASYAAGASSRIWIGGSNVMRRCGRMHAGWLDMRAVMLLVLVMLAACFFFKGRGALVVPRQSLESNIHQAISESSSIELSS